MLSTTRNLTTTALLTLLVACGGNDPAPGQGATGDASEPAAMTRSAAPPGAAVFIITPMNGATVGSPVTVKFGISGMTVAPAGDSTPDTGHHHLLIDTDLADPSLPIPSDPGHIHFGKGQTETSIELAAGRHTLQLVLGDGNHVPHEPPVMSEIVTITVQ